MQKNANDAIGELMKMSGDYYSFHRIIINSSLL